MTRVGFVLTFGNSSWTGAINYYRNLLVALATMQGRQIEPVIFTSRDAADKVLEAFPSFEIIKTDQVDTELLPWKLSKMKQRLLGSDRKFENFLRQHGIQALSHSGHMGSRASVPTLGWIPDFQHRHMPAFFSEAELAERDRRFRRLMRNCTRTIVSSHAALQDAITFEPALAKNCRVLQFVSGIAEQSSMSNSGHIAEKYGLQHPYFHLPNQFWAHKNHRVVLQALSHLKRAGCYARVVVTGNTLDSRQPKHFEALMKYAEELDVLDCFKVLGLVPFADLQCILGKSIGIINPSLFEGWSTTVEEAKSLGKSIILSDIPVHREQAPSRAHYFAPDNSQQLADQLSLVLASYDAEEEHRFECAATSALSSRMQRFAETYQDMVLECVPGKR